MAKTETGLSVNKIVRCLSVKNGKSLKGKDWQFFGFTDSTYDKEKKTYVKHGNYQIFINKPIEGLKSNDLVKIKKITSIKQVTNTFNGRVYTQLVVNVDAEPYIKKEEFTPADSTISEVEDPTFFDVNDEDTPF